MGYRVSARGTVSGRGINAPVAVVASPRNAAAKHFEYGLVVALITLCCLAIEIMAPAQWQPDVFWLLLAPAGGLTVARHSGAHRRPAVAAHREDGAGKGRPDRPSAEGLCRRAQRLGLVVRRRGQAAGRVAKIRAACRAAVGLARRHAAGRTARRGADRQATRPDEITVSMRQRQPFHNLEARIVAGGTECTLADGRQADVPRRALRRAMSARRPTSPREFRARETMTLSRLQ